jgi:hypothetical protein
MPPQVNQNKYESSILKSEGSDADMEKMSDLSMIPTPTREKHNMEVENLKW